MTTAIAAFVCAAFGHALDASRLVNVCRGAECLSEDSTAVLHADGLTASRGARKTREDASRLGVGAPLCSSNQRRTRVAAFSPREHGREPYTLGEQTADVLGVRAGSTPAAGAARPPRTRFDSSRAQLVPAEGRNSRPLASARGDKVPQNSKQEGAPAVLAASGESTMLVVKPSRVRNRAGAGCNSHLAEARSAAQSARRSVDPTRRRHEGTGVGAGAQRESRARREMPTRTGRHSLPLGAHGPANSSARRAGVLSEVRS